MKKTIYTMALGVLLLAGCSQEEGMGEEIQVTFTADMSTGVQSRSDASTMAVDKMICAVFTQDKSKELIRDTVDVTDGKATFTPTLLKGDTYHIVFWAYKANAQGGSKCYDMTQLTSIKFNPKDCASEEIEAYTQTLNNVMVATVNTTVTLTRPLAQVNVASSTTDWDNAVALGKTPTSAELKLEKCYDTYNALDKTYSSSATEGITHTYAMSSLSKDNIFSQKDGKNYFLLASGYTLGKNTISCTIVVKDQDAGKMFDYTIGNVPTDANYRTNISSENLMTGKVSFTLSVEEGYENEDKNEEIE